MDKTDKQKKIILPEVLVADNYNNIIDNYRNLLQ